MAVLLRRYIKKIIIRLIRLRHRLIKQLVGMFGRLRRAEHIFMVLTAIAIGVLGAFGAIFFRYLIKITHHAFFQTDIYSLDWVSGLSWWQKLGIPVLGGL
ncbi:MAG: hypothetical protein AB7T22_12920, partial [Calditrichaceae bacterium]